MEASVQKKVLRDKLISARKAIPAEDRAKFSKSVCQKLLKLPEVEKAKTILSYMPQGSELDLSGFDQACQKAGKTIIYPEFMDAFEKIDLVVAPGVGFDLHGNRLGRGRAYYDLLLAEVKKPVIGVCFDLQIVDSLPTHAHDVKMTYLVTEKQVVKF